MTAKVARVAEAIRKLTPAERGELAGALVEIAPKSAAELVENLHDLRILRERRNEPTRPYDDFMKELKRKRRI